MLCRSCASQILLCRMSVHTMPPLYSKKLRIADQEGISKAKKKIKPERLTVTAFKDKRSKKTTKTVVSNVPPPNSKFWARIPTDDVWIQRHYPKRHYKLEQCINMHRQFAVAEMLDNVSGLVSMDLILCMKTKKKTKFVSAYTDTLLFPHHFDLKQSRKIMALSKDPENIKKALEMGATLAGGTELIHQIQNDDVEIGDIDVTLCTVDMLQELVAIKDKIREFPSKTKGTTGLDMDFMMTKYTKGYTYRSVRDKSSEDNLSVAMLSAPIGKLDMPIEHLEKNWSTWKEALSKQRTSPNLGPVILEAKCTCSPSPEVFHLLPTEIGHSKVDVSNNSSTSGTSLVEDDDVDEDDDNVNVEEKRAV